MTELVLRTVIQAKVEQCFRLSLSVDAHTASMGRSKERAVAGVTEGEMSLGDSVTWRAMHFGVPFRMTSAITAYDRPHRFVDQQARGPFREWWHEHTFIVHGGSTLMTDVVRYSAPAGPLGRLIDGLVLRSYMQRLLELRNAWLKSELVAAPTHGWPVPPLRLVRGAGVAAPGPLQSHRPRRHPH